MADIPGKSPYKGSGRGTEGTAEGGGGLATPKSGGSVINQTPPKGGGGAPYKSNSPYAGKERGTEE